MALRREEVYFYSGPGVKISGTLNIPEGIKQGEKRTGIVLCPGAYGLSQMVPFPELAQRLTDEGYVALQLEYRGFGKSDGPRWRLDHWGQIEDVRSALTFLETRPEVSAQMGLWGTSAGGYNVILAAAFDSRVKCTVAAVPAVGFVQRGKMTPEDEALTRKFQEDRSRRVLTGKSDLVDPFKAMYSNPTPDEIRFWTETRKQVPERAEMRIPSEAFAGRYLDNFAFSVIDAVDKIAPRPILFVLATKDRMYPQQLKLYEKAGEPKKKVLVETTHHGSYWSPYLEKTLDASTEWFHQYLPPK